MEKYKGKIVEIVCYKCSSNPVITQGIKADKQYKYEQKYKGGNGTYVTGYESNPSELFAKIYVPDLEDYFYLDIKIAALKINSRKRISDNMIKKLNDLNQGKFNQFYFEDNLILQNIDNISKLHLVLK
ncbi:hypothetical protein ACV3WI_08790 [Clostridium perfringens]|uniref:hypothetical protein n=1 Tax=Clostridium perfringens TaxID=1502 RepID=UPI0018E46740|nr:hypothetical protein [Clostridium perfringens]MBI6076706.1 hypothetical protein [Clostridium perfringens]MDK0765003.1 hypothetical protein [Clostridium perfringens]MDK0913249.1 hypothetical protein [Clostridium perfringens]MDK0950826.1 hypothetical protein [Clostridium perfringens]MDM0742144.1 hypothetical protein [Clostridium perfringens]